MKCHRLLVLMSVFVPILEARAYVECSSTQPYAFTPKFTLSVSEDAGVVDALIVSLAGKSWYFFPSKKIFALSANSSQSPGFDKIRYSSSSLQVFQSDDVGTGEWISYNCL